jgi:DNA-binding NarL/FixJ family response regulator
VVVLHPLTAREAEVAELVRMGLSNGQIAAELVIEERTVRAHVSAVLHKWALDGRVDIARVATEERLHR